MYILVQVRCLGYCRSYCCYGRCGNSLAMHELQLFLNGRRQYLAQKRLRRPAKSILCMTCRRLQRVGKRCDQSRRTRSAAVRLGAFASDRDRLRRTSHRRLSSRQQSDQQHGPARCLYVGNQHGFVCRSKQRSPAMHIISAAAGFTVTGCRAALGAAIRVSGGAPQLRDLVLLANAASQASCCLSVPMHRCAAIITNVSPTTSQLVRVHIHVCNLSKVVMRRQAARCTSSPAAAPPQ